jgi:hypothetical protein
MIELIAWMQLLNMTLMVALSFMGLLMLSKQKNEEK